MAITKQQIFKIADKLDSEGLAPTLADVGTLSTCTQLATMPNRGVTRRLSLDEMLASFDPARHGGEVMGGLLGHREKAKPGDGERELEP